MARGSAADAVKSKGGARGWIAGNDMARGVVGKGHHSTSPQCKGMHAMPREANCFKMQHKTNDSRAGSCKHKRKSCFHEEVEPHLPRIRSPPTGCA